MYLHRSNPPKRSSPPIFVPNLEDPKEIISRTDLQGNILFYNKNFAKVSGYSREELLNAPHNILRHPQMPRAIFYLLWRQLLAGIPTKAIIQNLSKEGESYWVSMHLIPLRDAQHQLISFLAQGELTPVPVIQQIQPLYAHILADEKQHGMHHSIKLLSDLLVRQGIASYGDFVHRISLKRREGFLNSLGLF